MIDWNQLLDDAKGRLQTVTGFQTVFIEANDRDINYPSMPLADVRMARGQPEIRAGQDYVLSAIFEVEIVALSLSSRAEAATIRNDLLNEAINALRAQPRFFSGAESILIGPIQFETEENDENAHTAGVVFEVQVICYADRS